MRNNGCQDLHFLSQHICQIICQTYQQHPEWVVEKYRKYAWNQQSFRDQLTLKFLEELQKYQTEEEWILKTLKLLQSFLKPSFLITEEFQTFWASISQVFGESSHNPQTKTSSFSGISILLLDAENIQLNIEAENLMTHYCQYPLQIKIAFANWRNLGKQDVDYHQRNYELIHVPAGKDSADLKMVAFGTSVSLYYPTVKEVVICSSDKALTTLSDTLQSQGLIVYLVSRQGETITIFNSLTGHTQTKIIKPIPSINHFIQQLKDLIESEQKQTLKTWVKLSKLSQLYKAQYNLRISEVITGHFPDKKAKDIFLSYPSEFVIHQLDPQSELYVTLFQNSYFEKSDSGNSSISDSTLKKADQLQDHQINSKEELEKVILKIFTEVSKSLGKNEITVAMLAGEFNKQYGQGVNQVIKRLQLGGQVITFLKACSSFKLIKAEKEYKIKLSKR